MVVALLCVWLRSVWLTSESDSVVSEAVFNPCRINTRIHRFKEQSMDSRDTQFLIHFGLVADLVFRLA